MDAELEDPADLLAGLFVEVALRDGHVNPEGKTDREVVAELLRFMGEWIESDQIIGVRPDHQQNLLAEARGCHDRGQYDLAITIYATIVEHWLNAMVMAGVVRQGLSEQDGKHVIRDVPFRAKTSWLWRLCLVTLWIAS